jgi:hypothetical protein
MTIFVAVTARNSSLDALVSSFGTGVVLKLWSGTVPSGLSGTDTGATLITYTLSVLVWTLTDGNQS